MHIFTIFQSQNIFFEKMQKIRIKKKILWWINDLPKWDPLLPYLQKLQEEIIIKLSIIGSCYYTNPCGYKIEKWRNKFISLENFAMFDKLYNIMEFSFQYWPIIRHYKTNDVLFMWKMGVVACVLRYLHGGWVV